MGFVYQQINYSNGKSSSNKWVEVKGGEDKGSQGISHLGEWSENYLGRPGWTFITRADISLRLRIFIYACGYFITAANIFFEEADNFWLILCKKNEEKFQKVK